MLCQPPPAFLGRGILGAVRETQVRYHVTGALLEWKQSLSNHRYPTPEFAGNTGMLLEDDAPVPLGKERGIPLAISFRRSYH